MARIAPVNPLVDVIRLARRLLGPVRIALTGVAIIWICTFFLGSREDILAAASSIDAGRLLLAAGLVLVGLIPGAWAWQRLVTASIPSVGTLAGILVYLRAGIGKYTPGGALAFAIQHRLLVSSGASLGGLVRLFLGNALAACVAAAALSIPAVLALLGLMGQGWLGWGLTGLSAAFLALLLCTKDWPLSSGRIGGIGIATPRLFAQTAVLMIFAWILTGSHLVVLIGVSGAAAVFVISAFALSAIVGLVFAALPGALGVRDGSLLAILSLQLEPGDAMVATILSRALIVFADVAGTAVAILLRPERLFPEEVSP